MPVDQIIQDLIAKLIELPDLTGMNRCAGFFMLYQGFQLLKQQIEANQQKHKEEILILKAQIQDLEDQLKEGANRNGPEQ